MFTVKLVFPPCETELRLELKTITNSPVWVVPVEFAPPLLNPAHAIRQSVNVSVAAPNKGNLKEVIRSRHSNPAKALANYQHRSLVDCGIAPRAWKCARGTGVAYEGSK